MMKKLHNFHASGRPKRMHRRHVKDTTEIKRYVFATETKDQAYDLDKDKPTVTAFLQAQTAYVNSLHTYNKVNPAIHNSCKHLIFTQLDIEAGIKMRGQPIVEAIIKKMK